MQSEIQGKLDLIVSEVKKKTGINIEDLKPSFLERRVLYRMRAAGITNFDDYLKTLISDPNEAKTLYASISINVTKFFRDPHVWNKITESVLPSLLTQVRFSSLSAWSCGCASGEEPYSISIMLANFLRHKKLSYHVFATDINPIAIEHAKKGVYNEMNLVNVKDLNKQTYFEKLSEKEFKIKAAYKNQIKFQSLDMLYNTKNQYDLIFCRNVLIYYDKIRHEKIFEKFYNSLKDNGFLILGQDESMIGTKARELFNLVYPRERIYQKLPANH